MLRRSFSKGLELQKATTSKSSAQKGCRELAVEILLKVDTRKAYADILLDNSLEQVSLASRDRALLTELVYGTLRWRGRIDWHLSLFLRRPLSRMSPYLRNLLRCALYQLLFLDRIPDYAAVNETVEMAKRYGGAKAAGLVNGVLREVLRKRNETMLPDPQVGPVRYLSVLWSHPEWLVKKWSDYFGKEEAAALLEGNNEESPVIVRANTLKGGRAELLEKFHQRGIEAEQTDFSPQGIRLKSSGAVDELPGWKEGLFQVQGEASQLIGFLLSPQPGERILDACAAPGGKTTHLAELMGDRGEVIATDVSSRGLEKLKQNVQRLGLTSIRAYCQDVAKGLGGPLMKRYDRILVDAPCSGLGTLRSHPEAKWQRREDDIGRLSMLQKKIVARVSSYLRPGGVLVYATCTLTREENEQVVEDFLSHSNDFVLEEAKGYLPLQAERMTRGKYFLALPHRHNTDGFFAARMKKAA